MKDNDLQRSNVVVLDIMFQIASGLLYLHNMNVAHCDFKPENILVNPLSNSILTLMGYVKVKLIDFGVSKIEGKNVHEEPTKRNLGYIRFKELETSLRDDEMIHVVSAF